MNLEEEENGRKRENENHHNKIHPQPSSSSSSSSSTSMREGIPPPNIQSLFKVRFGNNDHHDLGREEEKGEMEF